MKNSVVALALVAGGVFACGAQGVTIATFADPASGSSPSLFQFNSSTNVLTGGWANPGMLLQTPGVAAPDFANATFTMTPLTVVGSVGPVLVMSAGQVNFFDSSSNPLLTISFSGGFLNPAVNLGASDFTGFNVSFSGPILSPFTTTNEAFSFSFANPTSTANGYTVTSSFTSSADLVPAPGAAALLGLGGLVACRRRR